MAGGWNAGSITSKLVLDKSKWSASVKDVAKDQKTLGGAIQKNSASFKKMGMAMTVAGGAIVASMGLMIKKYVTAGDQIDKMSKRTGFAAETLSELRYAAEISGANIESLEKGVKRMAKTIVDAGDGMATYIRSFDRIGVSVKDLQDLNPEQQFLTIAEAIAKVEDPTIRAATAQDIFGRAGTQLLPLFNLGVDGMEALRKKAHELGIVFDKEAAEKAARLADAQLTLSSALRGVTISIAENLAPALSKLAEDLSETIAKVGAWIKEHPKLTGIIAKATLGIGALLTVLGPLTMMLPGIIAALPAIAMGIHAILGPLGLVTAAAVVAYNVINNLIEAQKSLADAEMTAIMSETEHYKQLTEIGRAAGLTAKEIHNLKDKYNDNYAALGMAIRKGKEGVELQKAQIEYGKKHKEIIDEQKKSLITLKDFGIKPVIQSLEQVATVITNTAIPAGKKFLGFNYNLQSELKSGFFQTWDEMEAKGEETEKAVEKSWDELHPYWSNLCTDLGTSFGNFAGSILTTGSDLNDALSGLWGDIKSSFIGMIVDMVADWTTKFVKNILSSVTNIGSEITKGIGGAATGASSVISTTASAAGSLLGTVNTLAIVALAVAAIFSLFKKGADLSYTNTLLEDINWIQLNAVNKKLDVANENLHAIYKNLSGATSAQFGAVITSPQLVMAHGTPSAPEYIVPSRAVESFIPEMRTPGITRNTNVNISLQPVFHFNNQVDPNFTRKHVQKEVLPALMTLLETGSRKTKLKEIMGVA